MLAHILIDGATANTITDNSVYIGANTKASAVGVTNENVFGYDATGAGSNSVILGNDNILTTVLKGSVGIGDITPDTGTTNNPQALKLDVEGAIGASFYCDENGDNCKGITEMGISCPCGICWSTKTTSCHCNGLLRYICTPSGLVMISDESCDDRPNCN